jgi:hypothetical protein
LKASGGITKATTPEMGLHTLAPTPVPKTLTPTDDKTLAPTEDAIVNDGNNENRKARKVSKAKKSSDGEVRFTLAPTPTPKTLTPTEDKTLAPTEDAIVHDGNNENRKARKVSKAKKSSDGAGRFTLAPTPTPKTLTPTEDKTLAPTEDAIVHEGDNDKNRKIGKMLEDKKAIFDKNLLTLAPTPTPKTLSPTEEFSPAITGDLTVATGGSSSIDPKEQIKLAAVDGDRLTFAPTPIPKTLAPSEESVAADTTDLKRNKAKAKKNLRSAKDSMLTFAPSPAPKDRTYAPTEESGTDHSVLHHDSSDGPSKPDKDHTVKHAVKKSIYGSTDTPTEEPTLEPTETALKMIRRSSKSQSAIYGSTETPTEEPTLEPTESALDNAGKGYKSAVASQADAAEIGATVPMAISDNKISVKKLGSDTSESIVRESSYLKSLDQPFEGSFDRRGNTLQMSEIHQLKGSSEALKSSTFDSYQAKNLLR